MARPAVLPTEAPTAAELVAAHRARYPYGEIGRRIGTPSPELASRILDGYGRPMEPRDLFVCGGQPSNTNADMYYTKMSEETLDNYRRDALAGRSLMLSHDYEKLAVGQSF